MELLGWLWHNGAAKGQQEHDGQDTEKQTISLHLSDKEKLEIQAGAAALSVPHFFLVLRGEQEQGFLQISDFL